LKKLKKYKVLQSASYAEWVEVEAENEDKAIEKVDFGNYNDKDVISSELVIRETTGDAEVVSDERT